MTPRGPSLEDKLIQLLADYDEALRAGDTPAEGASDSADLPSLQRDRAYLHLLRQALRPGVQTTAPEAAHVFPSSGREEGQAKAELPWKTLGRFEIVRELGQGGFGVVLLAWDSLLGREVALKVPRAEVLLTPAFRERFHKEARAAASLDHPNVVPVHEVGEAGALCFIVSAYCPGISLSAWLGQCQEPVPFDQAAGLCATLADAVQHAHDRGVVHRDLKPGNILLARGEQELASGDREAPLSAPEPSRPPLAVLTPRITDFGLAKLLGEESGGELTQSGAILGTPRYMAPEQAAGKAKEVGPAADIYALGVILYELLTGRTPFVAETNLEMLLQVQTVEPVSPSRLRPKVPRDLETICLKCLEKEPRKRYGSAQALADDLRCFQSGVPIRARPVGPGERLWRWCRRKPALAAASALAVVAALATLAVLGVVVELATQSREAALKDAERETASRKKAERDAARFSFEDSLGKCLTTEASWGLLALAHSLEVASKADAPDIEEAVRAQLHGWSRYVHPLRAVLPHDSEVTALAFSPDGKIVLTGSEAGTARLWDARTGESRSPPLKHKDRVTSAAFSPDGQTVVTASRDTTARLWKTSTAEEACPALKHRDYVNAVFFSPDGRLVLTGEEDRARLWDARTGKPVGRDLRVEGELSSLAFSPDGRWILSAASDNKNNSKAQLWDARTGTPVGASREYTGNCPVAFSPDGKTFLMAFEFYETSTRKLIRPTPDDLGGSASNVAFSPGGTTVLAGSEGNRTAQLWDVQTGKALGPPLRHQDGLNAVAFGPDGNMVLTGSKDRTARLWDIRTGFPVGPPLQHQAPVEHVVFSPDGKTVLTGSGDRTVRLWEVATGKALGSLPHGSTVNRVAFSPNGRTALTMTACGPLQLWDVGTREPLGKPFGKLPRSPANPHDQQFPRTAAFSSDSQSLLISYAGVAQRWEVRTGKVLGAPMPYPGVHIHAYHPDGKTVVFLQTGPGGTFMQLWDLAAGKALAPQNHSAPMAFSPDGKSQVTGEELQRLSDKIDAAAVVISSDGRTLLTGCSDRTARLWDLSTGKSLGPPLPHQDKVTSVAFSPDGRTALTGSDDQTARLWDVQLGKPVGPPLLHSSHVSSVAFNPDGKTFLTGSDGSAHLWQGPALLAGDSRQILLWLEVLTGLELDDHGMVQVLDAATWQQRRQLLEKDGTREEHPGR